MARYQVILAYDGTDFHGFQRQGEARTVQSEVEAALRRLGWDGRSILTAGRTDSGVHASGQVIAFDLNWAHSLETLKKAFNAHLPPDVAVMQVRETFSTFHPRYAAQSRTYHYRIYFSEGRDPLRDRFAWRLWPGVDMDLLKQAAASIPGTYDFSAFGAPTRIGGTTTRTVYRAEWFEEGEFLRFEVAANAFLYHMVRRLVFGQVLVAQGRESIEEFTQGILNAREQMPGMAPPQGLALVQVEFPDVQE